MAWDYTGNPLFFRSMVIPGRREAASPESIFQKPVFMDSGPRPSDDPGMTDSY